jgi:hypothetical protein
VTEWSYSEAGLRLLQHPARHLHLGPRLLQLGSRLLQLCLGLPQAGLGSIHLGVHLFPVGLSHIVLILGQDSLLIEIGHPLSVGARISRRSL